MSTTTAPLRAIPSRSAIRKKFIEVCEALDKNNWNCPCDGKFKGQTRGDIYGFKFFQTPCYLFCLRAAYIISKDSKWEKKYRTALREKISGGKATDARQPTRLDICAGGHMQDEGWLRNINKNMLWIYVKNYAVLRELYDAETDPEVKDNFRKGLENGASAVVSTLREYSNFDNLLPSNFMLSDWKKYFKSRPQNSQSDAQKLALEQFNIKKVWDRRNYERYRMTTPLSAASICAFSGNPKYSGLIEEAIAHYDYSKLNLGEMFLAELASWFNSPRNRPTTKPASN